MKEVFNYQLVFTKIGVLKYISHLDILRLFQRALRRADFPLVFSQGFHPLPKIKFERALKLGVESKGEKLYLKLRELFTEKELIIRLNKQLPQGIQIISASRI